MDVIDIDEIYEWANSLGSVEWLSGMDDLIVARFQQLLNAGITTNAAKEIIESLVNGACQEVYNQHMPCP